MKTRNTLAPFWLLAMAFILALATMAPMAVLASSIS